jgi:hypothetical protein
MDMACGSSEGRCGDGAVIMMAGVAERTTPTPLLRSNVVQFYITANIRVAFKFSCTMLTFPSQLLCMLPTLSGNPQPIHPCNIACMYFTKWALGGA